MLAGNFRYLLFFLLQNRFPFDVHNPIGYLIAFIIEYSICIYTYLLGACTLSLEIGLFWIATSVTKEIHCILSTIKEKMEANEDHLNEELRAFFPEFMNTHAALKQLSI